MIAEIGLSVFCMLNNIEVPQIRISNLTFQPWVPNRRLCPKFDSKRDTIFHLYTRPNTRVSRIITPHDDESVYNSGIDFNHTTIIFFHGWLESIRSDNAQSIKDTYLQTGDYNVILVQNERLIAGPDYLTAASNCKPIARYTGAFIDYLVSKGLHLSRLLVMGMSLGGQMAGMTGQFVTSGVLPRISAFDPAGPFFNHKDKDERVDISDAKFVDVIHTNAGVFGIKYAVGQLDFWPNGGKKQPGCSVPEIIRRYGFAINWLLFCHHYRSYQLYVESILSPHSYPSHSCSSYAAYQRGKCSGNRVTYMGIGADDNAEGNFYVDTGYSGVYNG